MKPNGMCKATQKLNSFNIYAKCQNYLIFTLEESLTGCDDEALRCLMPIIAIYKANLSTVIM